MTPAAGHRGVTLVETLIAMVIVGLLAAATQSATHVIFTTREEAESSQLYTELATSLLMEVTALPFDDPETASTTLGPDAGEWSPPTDRTLFDDVDDYTAWNGSQTLQQKDGTAIGISDLTRSVSISYANPDNPSTTSLTPTDCKLIIVKVLEKGTIVKTLTTLRLQGGRDVDFDS